MTSAIGQVSIDCLVVESGLTVLTRAKPGCSIYSATPANKINFPLVFA